MSWPVQWQCQRLLIKFIPRLAWLVVWWFEIRAAVKLVAGADNVRLFEVDEDFCV